jgi:hypothetical protein
MTSSLRASICNPSDMLPTSLAIVAIKLHCCMPTIIKSDAFAEWIDNLRDRAGAAQVLRRLARWSAATQAMLRPLARA